MDIKPHHQEPHQNQDLISPSLYSGSDYPSDADQAQTTASVVIKPSSPDNPSMLRTDEPSVGAPAASRLHDLSNGSRPVPVVRVLSPLGIEYVFMTLSLFIAAGGLSVALLAMVNGQFSYEVLSFPAAVLVVNLPIFAWLFLRTKKRELSDPSLRFDPSKRRSTQFTQIASFIISVSTLVGLVYTAFAAVRGNAEMSLVKALLNGVVLLVVFGGILMYYWHDEHRV